MAGTIMPQAYKEGGPYSAFATTSGILQTLLITRGYAPPEAPAGSQLRESIARTARRLDIAGVLGVRLYLPTDVLDMHVCGAGLAEEVSAPEMGHDLLAIVDPPRRGGQER